MLFNSIHFAIFFPIVSWAFFLLRGRARWALLLLASSYFYMVLVPAYIAVLLLLIAIDYFAALRIEGASGKQRTGWFAASLIANLGVLFVFKYLKFATEQVDGLLTITGSANRLPILEFLLPVGLSFHTFQSMSYTIEVYRGRQKPERNLAVYALYVLFYPQLVAGPIERPERLLPQIHDSAHTSFDSERASSGLRLMLWGLLKKTVVADGLAVIVDRTYGGIRGADSVALLVAAYAFSIQIYCDFSGYTDIARGAARFIGFDLVKNFERPYEATSVAAFWRRWHLSLSGWFRDYLYIPLGGSRHGSWRTLRNIGIVFLVSGLWHGANWTFAVWGAIHGLLVAGEWLWSNRSGAPVQASGFRVLKWLLTFHALTLAWVIFRAPNLSVAWLYLSRLFSGIGFGTLRGHNLGSPTEMLVAFGAAAVLLGLESAAIRFRLVERLLSAPRAARWLVYYVGIIILLLSASRAPQQFIYFQF